VGGAKLMIDPGDRRLQRVEVSLLITQL